MRVLIELSWLAAGITRRPDAELSPTDGRSNFCVEDDYIPCPISFTKDQIRETKRQAEEWAVAFNEFNDLRSKIAGKDGWV